MNEHSFINFGEMPMESRADRKKRITRQRQEQILEAALLVFSQRGFDRATIPDIAHEAGIAVGTIYNYYQNKRDLLVAITNKYVIEPFTRIVEHAPAGVDDAYVVASLIENRLSFGVEGIARFLPLLMEVQRDDELRRRYTEQVLQPVMAMMGKHVASRVEVGAFRDVNPALVTRMAGGMVIGFLLLYRIEGESSPAYGMDRKKLANELADFILNGLQRH
jgi:AcrR family transcriptional regulator